MSDAAQRLVDALIATAAEFYRRGWMWGTSGNLSVKLPGEPAAIVITGSGASKGQLTRSDLAVLPAEVRPRYQWLGQAARKPSAETCIHQAMYEELPQVGAVLHVHTVATTVVALPRPPEGYLLIEGLEMLKGWDIPWQGGRLAAELPVLANQERMEDIAREVRGLLRRGLETPAFLVAGHGVTAWGKDLEQARNRLEISEFLCQALVQQRR